MYEARYPAPPAPSPRHVCKRADYDSYPTASAGAKIVKKGACDARGANRYVTWPLKPRFQITVRERTQMAPRCLAEFDRRKRGRGFDPHAAFPIDTTMSGRIHIRYCFQRTSGTGRLADCGKEGVHRTYMVRVPVRIACTPR